VDEMPSRCAIDTRRLVRMMLDTCQTRIAERGHFPSPGGRRAAAAAAAAAAADCDRR